MSYFKLFHLTRSKKRFSIKNNRCAPLALVATSDPFGLDTSARLTSPRRSSTPIGCKPFHATLFKPPLPLESTTNRLSGVLPTSPIKKA
ncbi:hypothetical protein PGT21_026745 [Puccinia graminis f. sp. tritici]|uniref:Uncharacterized protein n=1 Tax=Puccinia graminis f. sp. tritici TaxID=56615 RepID=A0A5B0NDG5_PUCGR|nr:hypothetical protein PGT21_026745 [Puccinia graminis f. sp. tritici]